ncbi:hypothetical protein SAY86_024269 [Trapa natans]|uniref:Uncharacterized protein n=1 Tax=Trapa natans TaxID=22666 RepID=A0AAN7RBC3_TRANT|nr:hypothetical protein SAY86_024269 [Trapa natans]
MENIFETDLFSPSDVFQPNSLTYLPSVPRAPYSDCRCSSLVRGLTGSPPFPAHRGHQRVESDENSHQSFALPDGRGILGAPIQQLSAAFVTAMDFITVDEAV